MDAITSPTPNNSLRERMLQDMTMRGFGEHTQKDYIRHVRSFAAFLGRPPDTATIEDLRRFQIDQHERAVGPATINGTVSALRFLFGITLKRPEMALGLVVMHYAPKLRVVLSVEETARLLEAAPGIKYKAALSVAMARACVSRRLPTSRSMTSTAPGCLYASSRARDARIATPCSHRICWTCFVNGGAKASGAE